MSLESKRNLKPFFKLKLKLFFFSFESGPFFLELVLERT